MLASWRSMTKIAVSGSRSITVVRGMDPRIRIHTKMSWIRNSAFKKPKNRFQGTDSARLCSLAGRYDIAIPTRFLALQRLLKIPAQGVHGSDFLPLHGKYFIMRNWYKFRARIPAEFWKWERMSLKTLDPDRKHCTLIIIPDPHWISSPRSGSALAI